VLQYYNMHADITQENNLTHTQSNLSTVSELWNQASISNGF